MEREIRVAVRGDARAVGRWRRAATPVVIAAFLAVLAPGVSLAQSSSHIGYQGTATPSDTGTCYDAGRACTYFSDGSAQFSVPATGSVTTFSVVHGTVPAGASEQVALLALRHQDGSAQWTVDSMSELRSLAAPRGRETFTLSTPLPVTYGDKLGVVVVPDANHLAVNVLVADGPGGVASNGCEDGVPQAGQSFQGSANCATIAANGYQVAVDANLVDSQPPPTVTGYTSPTQVTSTSAALHATINPQGRQTSFRFCWYTGHLSGGAIDPNGAGCTGISTIPAGATAAPVDGQATGLTPGTRYFYVVQATNQSSTDGTGGSTVGPEQNDLTTPASSQGASSTDPTAPSSGLTIAPVSPAPVITPYHAAEIAFYKATLIKPLPPAPRIAELPEQHWSVPTPANCNALCVYAGTILAGNIGLWNTDGLQFYRAGAAATPVPIGKVTLTGTGDLHARIAIAPRYRRRLLHVRRPVTVTVVEKITDKRYGFVKRRTQKLVLRP